MCADMSPLHHRLWILRLRGHAMSLSTTSTLSTEESSSAPHPDEAPSLSASKWLALVAASLGLFMLYIDLFIVNVALPAIGRDFHASLATASWTVTGYVLMIGVLPLGMG